MRKLLQELAECERMMKLAAEANNGLKRIPVNPDAQIKPPVTEPSNPGTKTTTASPAVKPPASPARRPNSTSAPAASTRPYQHGFIAATHDTEAGPIQMVQRRNGTVDLQLLDTHGNPQPLTLDRQAQYLRRADWNVYPTKDGTALDGTTYKFYVSPYGITREAVRDGNSTWTQMDPCTGQMRDPDVHFRYPQPEGLRRDGSRLIASAPIPKISLMGGSPSLEVRQLWNSRDKTFNYEYYNPVTKAIRPAESGDAKQLRDILVSSPDRRYYELPETRDGSIEYVYNTADGTYKRVCDLSGRDSWFSYHHDADPSKRGYVPYKGAPEVSDPTPSPLKPETVSEGKPAGEPSETPAASQEPTTPAASQEPTTPSTAEDPEVARRAAYIKDHGERPEWDKAVPAESIWSDPTFQSNTLTGLGVGLLGGLGGYALTGGQGGLAPWLMLGGGISAGISGLSGYNQWNTNKTEYDDILKKQKAWDEGLAALTPVGTLEDGTPVTQGEVDSGNVQVVRSDEEGKPVFERVEQGLKGVSVPGKTGTRVDDKGGVWTEDGQERLPAEKNFVAKRVYDTTPFIGTGVGDLGGSLQDGEMRYVGFRKPFFDGQNLLGYDYHQYYVQDSSRNRGGYTVYAYPKKPGTLTNNPDDYVWYYEDGKRQNTMPLELVREIAARTPFHADAAHLLDTSETANSRNKKHIAAQNFSTWGLWSNDSSQHSPYEEDEWYWSWWPGYWHWNENRGSAR